ncbi:MAG: HAMP domain-containing histidine kinase, partial [Synergistaceae bacterium]|nr:HAMP domain-containing histidine kinase [Synergistaceae bacterium]
GMYSDQENDRIITEMSVLNLEMANMTRELHKKNLQLAVSQQALAKADSMKKTFLAIIAHDLRGHVGGVSQLLSMLQQDYDDMDDAEKKECVTLASDEARRTFLLLEDLLSWSRSQLDQIEFTPVDCNLRALIEENIALLQSRAKEKGVALSHETPPSLSATLDRSMMGTVLRNLLNNALKFTAPGGRVLVSASQKGESVEIIVRDTGTGMSQEQLENLFRIDAKPVSTQGTSGEKGSGLGLILCKEFVEKNGGMIRAESVAGEGSSFFILLPSARGASDGT